MITNDIDTEAKELLRGTTIAVGRSEALFDIKNMPEVSHALKIIMQENCQKPYDLITCSFLLGCYLGLQYHDMEKFTGEK